MSDKQEQLDEVEFIQAMSKDGEFEWEESTETGIISGTLNVCVQLDHPLSLRLVKRDKIGREKQITSEAQPDDKAMTPKHPQDITRMDSNPRQKTAQVDHLPPFVLYFQLPPTYPSVKMPEYSLTCKWLNFSQLTLLCKTLDGVWSDHVGGVVLYNWQQLLSNEALLSIGIDISSEVCLEFEDPRVLQEDWDPRAIQDIGHPYAVIPSLIEYDEKQKSHIFNESFFDCDVCFVVKQGSKCAKISSCQHTFCCECLSVYLKTKIENGEVAKMECPTCAGLIRPSLIKELVSVELFNRFDKLLLQRTLEGMGDVTYCPRPTCECATVKEEDSNMAQCPKCLFCFCVLCRQSWHGVAHCKLLPGDLKDLHETWEGLEEDDKRLVAEQYGGRKKIEQAFQEYESHMWVESNAKLCPSCSSKIQKSEGCNKMTCTQCHKHFCWLCDSPLPKHDPYSHFRVGAVNNRSLCVGKLFIGLTNFDEDDL